MLRDKDLFIGDGDQNTISPEDIAQAEQAQGGDTGVPTPEAGATEPVVPTTEEPITPETPATPEAPTEPVAGEQPTTEEPQKEKSISEILDELDEIGKSQDQKTEDIKQTTEDIKEMVKDSPELLEKLDTLTRQNAELESEKKKLQITIDFLQEQTDTLYKENVANKYGRADEDGLLNIINTDANLKQIISQTIKSQDKPDEQGKLVDLYKSQLEKLTGLDFTDFINQSKTKAEGELGASDTDVSTKLDTGMDGESLFI